MKKNLLFLICLLFLTVAPLFAQIDMLDLIKQDEETEYATASFKTDHVINLHSLENTAEGVLDFKVSHRFGVIKNGLYDLFGLDNAFQRFGFDYGVTNMLEVGLDRNSLNKAYDAFAKYKLLRQSSGKRTMPVTLSAMAGIAIETVHFSNPDRENFFSNRLNYTYQIIVGRKFSDAFSLELTPTLVHRNLVDTKVEKNDVYALGVAGRIRLTRRVAFTGEYIYVLPNQLAPGLYNSTSLGFDIETGGHVFQLHFTNSTSLSEYAFVTQNTDSWRNGDIHFGFNISRVFTLYDPKKKDALK